MRTGRGTGVARREGSGLGNALRVGRGKGDSRREGSGDGSAWRTGEGSGNAIRDGSGTLVTLAGQDPEAVTRNGLARETVVPLQMR